MSPVPALNLHHIGYAVNSIEPIAASYVSRFGYELVTPIIHDPQQTAWVQFLKLRGDSSYLEFVAPDGPWSKLANAVKLGTGIHHLCFIADRLEVIIAHLEQNKMKLISDPKPGVAFAGRRICWLLGQERLAIELVERRDDSDLCLPG
jgi:methylmalonyl-CoA/ethylmalonyl-CoA epimerase